MTNDNGQQLINWYPGHMAKSFNDIKKNAPLADIFIIVLDARCPISSYNEDFDQIAPQKPRLFIFSKFDLMDKSKKSLIEKRFQGEKLLWLNLQNPESKKIIVKEIENKLKAKTLKAKEKGFLTTKHKVFVLGVPNVGKSTLINLLLGKKTLKVANFPGVTKQNKWAISENLFLMDTPGILLPKMDDQEAAIKLAMIGSIETKIFPQSFIALNFYKQILKYYPEKLKHEFNIGIEVNKLDDISIYDFFTNLSVLKGFMANLKPELNKTYTYFINWVKNLKFVTFD